MKKSIIYVGVFDIDEIIDYCKGFGGSHAFVSSPKSSVRKGKENKYNIWGMRKINPYVKLEFDIDLFWLMKNPVDIKQGGKTKTAVRGKLKAEIKFKIDKDWGGRFGKTKTEQLHKKVFEKGIESELDEIDMRVIGYVNEWKDEMKKLLHATIR